MKSTQEAWAAPLDKHQKSIYCVSDPKNKGFYYNVLNIKLIPVTQGST